MDDAFGVLGRGFTDFAALRRVEETGNGHLRHPDGVGDVEVEGEVVADSFCRCAVHRAGIRSGRSFFLFPSTCMELRRWVTYSLDLESPGGTQKLEKCGSKTPAPGQTMSAPPRTLSVSAKAFSSWSCAEGC